MTPSGIVTATFRLVGSASTNRVPLLENEDSIIAECTGS